MAADRLSHDEIHDLGFNRRPDGTWELLDEAQERERTGLTRRQWRRWSPVTLRGTLAIPPGSLRAFEVTACLGKMRRKDGTFERIRNAEDILAVEVRTTHREKAKRVLRIGQRTWERHVSAWIGVSMAHRCTKGWVTLFLEPEKQCPSCQADLESDTTRRLEATPHVASSDTTRRPNVPRAGDAPRDGEGVDALEVQEVPEVVHVGARDGERELDQAEANLRAGFGTENVIREDP